MIDYQAALLGALIFVSAPCSDVSGQQQWIGKATAVDGDTIIVNKQRIRLWGIDAPELYQLCGDYQAGKVAHAFLEHIIDYKNVRCVAKDRDRFNRPVAICSNHAGADISRTMVAAGHAWAYARYSIDYVPDEIKARADKIGLWRFQCENPETWRRAHGTGQQPVPPLKGGR